MNDTIKVNLIIYLNPSNDEINISCNYLIEGLMITGVLGRYINKVSPMKKNIIL